MSDGAPTQAAAGIDPACPLCGSRARRELRRDGAHTLVRCEGCELCYVTPRREAALLLSEVYDASYWRSPAARERGYSDYAGEEALYLRTFRRRFDQLAPQLPRGGRALDVGCAAGFSMRVLEERGFEVFGIEPSAAIRAVALRHFAPERIHGGTLIDAPFDPGSFDLIVMWDVLEHLPDPVEGLRKAAALLTPEGRLVLETQNIEALAARVLGSRWTHFKHDEHLVHFSRKTLKRALESAGFELLSLTSRGAGKLVSPRFIAERARRLAPALAWAFAPLARLPIAGIYVNPFDELIAVARPAARA
ncbi:MAG TPA: class I SAM-dependent methyltransferase [Planctomycetota bacterium]|nr:class I SAM-dependent methyltransferase [Planctomycetota bacterium]